MAWRFAGGGAGGGPWRSSCCPDRPPAAGARRYGDLEIDLDGHAVRLGGADVRLTPTEFGLLAQLVANAGKVLTHRMLLQRVWGVEYGEEAEYLRVYMGRLRRKLEPDP